MKKFCVVISCLIAVLLVVEDGSAQDRKAGLTGAAFLKVGVGARAVALGQAVTALPSDVNQMFYNPAGIALKDQMFQASFSYNKWIADIGHNVAAVSYNWEDVGTIGIGFISFGVSNIPADRDIPLDPTLKQFQIETNTSATYDYRDMAYQVSFARYVVDRLSLGVTLKGINQSIDGLSVSAFAMDFGSVYHVGVLNWTIGARFNNLGSDLKFYDIAYGLPLSFTIGTALSPFKTESNQLMIAMDGTKPQDGPLYLFTGAEYTFMDMVALRVGYKFNYSGSSESPGAGLPTRNTTIEGISAGAGIRTTISGIGVAVDYSYTQMDLLDAAHRFTLTLGMK